jgi:SAM-dependent methyltransferase
MPAQRAILSNRFVAAKLLPLPGEVHNLLLKPGTADRADADGLPVPPRELWQRWGTTAEAYLLSGSNDTSRMLSILAESDVDERSLSRVLDFGCAEGRMLRAFPRANGSELWGVDINASRIAWAQQHVSPPFRFATTTTAPHLPFADDCFDLVYAVSVFTHIGELADAWLLELLRILKPGACIYLTIHDEHTVRLLIEDYRDDPTHAYIVGLLREFDEETGALSRDWSSFSILADPAAHVFYDRAALLVKWSQFADVASVTPEATGYQTALVLQKRLP